MYTRSYSRQRLSVPQAGLRSCIALLCLLLVNCGVIDWLGGKRIKRQYCEKHHNNQECQETYPDADTRCRSNAACMAPTPVCDLTGSMMCVQCVAPDQTAACTGTMPICDPDHTCHACRTHDDCPLSNACLPDGSCAMETEVAYVDSMQGSGTICSRVMPCEKVSEALATPRPYVKLTGMLDEPVMIMNKNVTILAAPSTTLTSTTGGVTLQIGEASVVKIVGLTITNGLTGGIGISLPPAGNPASIALDRVTVANNNGGGISASGGTVVISRSTITDNAKYGILILGSEFDITNCIIAGNGDIKATFGGVRFDNTNTGVRRFDFNTVTKNVANDNTAVGILCTVINNPMTFSNNIVYANRIGGTGTQVGGVNCNWTFSDIGQDAVVGTSNMNTDPLFMDPVMNDYHLRSMSPTKDAADPAATLSVDFDGDMRPQGPRRDIGADEVRQ